MKFDDQYEKLLNHYINEGIGAAIKDTLRRNFVDPAIQMNPWRNERGNRAQNSIDNKNTKDELMGKFSNNAKQSIANYGIDIWKILSDYQSNQIRSNIISGKKISFLNGGTVIGNFSLDCSGALKGVTLEKLLLVDSGGTPDQIQKGIEFISYYDLRRLNLYDAIKEKEFSSLIRNELLRAKTDPAKVGNKISEALNEYKTHFTYIFGPYDPRTQSPYQKILWFFILYKQNQLRK